MKRLIHHKNPSWLAGLLVILAVFLYFKTLNSYVNITSTYETQSSMQPLPYKDQPYISKFLKISFDVPGEFIVKENYNDIVLNNDNGEILLSRIGTNFDNLNEYIVDLSMKNKFEVNNKVFYDIDSIKVMKGDIISESNRGNIEKIYLIMPDSWVVYTLSTTTLDLYDELDQVAQSFEYLPSDL